MSIKILSGLEDVIEDYNHFIFDIWGVLHNGIEPFPHVIDTLKTLKSAHKHILLLSNTPSLNTTIAEMLADMGITHKMYDHIVTAGDSARHDILERKNQKCWCAGALHDESLLHGIDMHYVDHPDEADYMINAIYGNNEAANNRNIDLMRIATDRGLDMICPNPDKVVQVGNDLKLCPGTFAEIYETEMNGIVHYHGKPHTPIYEWAHEKLGSPDKAEILAVGDSLHTDIQGANNFGIDSVFNLVGIHAEELAQDYGGAITEEIITDFLTRSNHKPDLVLQGLRF